LIAEPGLEGVEQRRGSGVTRFAKRVGATATGAGNAQAEISQRTLRQANELRSFGSCHAK
jgi:hypothetical protein